MKYRRLSLSELESLSQDFVHFLVVNGIPAEEWVRIKSENLARTNQLLDDFSDLVYQTTIEKVNYLMRVAPKEILAFHCKEDAMTIASISLSTDESFDFTAFESLEIAMHQLPKKAMINRFSTKSVYKKTRDLEIFDLLENGCGISTEAKYLLITNK